MKKKFISFKLRSYIFRIIYIRDIYIFKHITLSYILSTFIYSFYYIINILLLNKQIYPSFILKKTNE